MRQEKLLGRGSCPFVNDSWFSVGANCTHYSGVGGRKKGLKGGKREQGTNKKNAERLPRSCGPCDQRKPVPTGTLHTWRGGSREAREKIFREVGVVASTAGAVRARPGWNGTQPGAVSPPDNYRPLMSRRNNEAGEANFRELSDSIDRSRKRHLEPGLLRGDQALDRLRTQEASASPVLKKPKLRGAGHCP